MESMELLVEEESVAEFESAECMNDEDPLARESMELLVEEESVAEFESAECMNDEDPLARESMEFLVEEESVAEFESAECMNYEDPLAREEPDMSRVALEYELAIDECTLSLEDGMNSVKALQLHPFSSRSLEGKIAVKKLGRPTPAINLKQTVVTKNKTFTRNFNPELYKKHSWLCGCDEKHALFCFSCILFGGQDVWTKTGVVDVQHLHVRIKKHETSSKHIKNVLSLSFLGRRNIAAQLDSTYRRTIELHNQNVVNNRYVLNIIINCIRFCGSFELALKDHDEFTTSVNPSVFGGLINFSAEFDSTLRTHLETATVFKGSSDTVQNELLQCMLEVCHEEISREIKDSDFLAMIADETSDVSNNFQLIIIFRYVIKDRPVERFWNLVVPPGHDAKSLATCILDEVNKHLKGYPRKLIAQTYDGSSIMCGSSHSVQALIKEQYSEAAYVHYYAHQVNLIMLNAASINRNVHIFFANLQAMCTFFSTSPQLASILDEVVKRRLTLAVPTKWNFQSSSVSTIYEYREELTECMATIQTTMRISNHSTIAQASGFLEILKNDNFLFWLTFFYQAMPHVEILFKQLQKRECNPSYVESQINSFKLELLKNKENIAMWYNEEISSKKGKNDDVSVRNREAKEVCDVIVQQVDDRFSFKGHLSAAMLFVSKNFVKYNQRFPEKCLKHTNEVYSFLNEQKLRTELSVIYSKEEFRTMSGAFGLFCFIKMNNLSEAFSECVKLLKVLLTIPMATSETERRFSSLKRIKTFLRNTMSEDKMSALAMLSVERDFIMKIRDFNERVIDKFAINKERRMDFLIL